ncbi:MAG: YggT family protein [Candidatus Parcubacteria bacterium]|nr:YggT family protein [Burkholderiales bacterium]
MLQQIAGFLVDVVVGFFVYLLLARFLFQWLRVPFRNPVGEFVIALTNWLVVPARRVIPSFAGLDLASLLLAWLLQGLLLYALFLIAGRDVAAAPGVAAAALAGLALIDLLRFTVYILVFALIVQAVLSWVSPYSPVAPVFDAITRPFLRPFRRFVPPLGNVDLSPLVLIVLLQVLLIPLSHLRAIAGGLI